MLLESVCSRYGYTLRQAQAELTWPMIYLLIDAHKAANEDGYGLEAMDNRPPKPDEKVDERGALEWQLQYEFNVSEEQKAEILARYDAKQQGGADGH